VSLKRILHTSLWVIHAEGAEGSGQGERQGGAESGGDGGGEGGGSQGHGGGGWWQRQWEGEQSGASVAPSSRTTLRGARGGGGRAANTTHGGGGRYYQPKPAVDVQRWGKLRIVALRFGTGRQKMALERVTNPKLSRRACTCEYGLQPCRGKSEGVASDPTRSP
jgi:hypothetical protein